MKKRRSLILCWAILTGLCQPTLAQTAPALDSQTKQATDPLVYWLDQLAHWTVVVYDIEAQSFQGQNADYWDYATLPASTYKVPHSLIGLHSGVINTQSRFAWDGKKRSLQAWNRDHDLASALQVSCVPCFQQLARKIGVLRMRKNLEQLQFGQMEVNPQNLDHFWLRGPSKISPRQQVLFLARLAQKQLPLDIEAQEHVLKIMQDPDIPGLHAKTGWGILPHQGVRQHVGWYVGIYRTPTHNYSFAVQLLSKDPPPPHFAQMRKEVLLRYLQQLDLLE